MRHVEFYRLLHEIMAIQKFDFNSKGCRLKPLMAFPTAKRC